MPHRSRGRDVRAAGAPTAASLVADAKIHLPLAIAWITSTQVRLGAVRQSIARFKVYSPAELELARPFATHVKVNIASQTDVVALSRLDRVAHTSAASTSRSADSERG